MRSTKELIDELKQEGTGHWVAFLPIAFDKTTIFVNKSMSDEDALTMLNDAVQQGGIPIGIIVGDKGDGVLDLKARIFPEHEQAMGQAEAYIEKLLGSVRDAMESGEMPTSSRPS